MPAFLYTSTIYSKIMCLIRNTLNNLLLMSFLYKKFLYINCFIDTNSCDRKLVTNISK